jgi:putative protease
MLQGWTEWSSSPTSPCRKYAYAVKILAPIASAGEAEPLVAAGADEFYAGLFPRGWYARWGRGAWPNRRGPGPANLETIEELETLSAAVRAAGPTARGERPELYVALNQQYYTDTQADFLIDVAAEAADRAGVDAFIVTDPGFGSRLVREVPSARVFASTVGVALNADSAKFFVDLGFSRVILSRHLHLREVERIRVAAPDIELEVFLLNDNCYFEEGFCSTTHTMPGFGVYCMTPWEMRVTRDDQDGAPLRDPEERARWDFLVEEHREFLRNLAHRGHGSGRTAMPLGPCGLCAIPELMALGIDSGKIVGREAALFRKIRSVQGVRHVRDVSEADSASAAKAAAVELRGDPRGCSGGYSCYYREARQRDLIPLPGRPRSPRRA